MQRCLIFLFIIIVSGCSSGDSGGILRADFIRLSQNMLSASRSGADVQAYVDSVMQLNFDELDKQLDSDPKRLAFWLNLYNSYIQIILKENPEKFKDRSVFFTANQINIGGNMVSLDLIEHGILRRSKIKHSYGYLDKLAAESFEKRFRVDSLDYRIHFALNCGAKSCPPIAFYDPQAIDQQLELAARSYLTGETSYNPLLNTVELPRIMDWFRADFGGESGMIQILKKYRLLPETARPKIRYKEYDWTLELENFKS